MAKYIWFSMILIPFLLTSGSWAQDSPTTGASNEATGQYDISGTWLTMTGNLVEVSVNGSDVTLVFPEYARTMNATLTGNVLVYITHYNDPEDEECYIDCPEGNEDDCRGFIQRGDERHRFTLTLAEDGMVLSGVKEINMMHVSWDTDENGHNFNFQPVGYEWIYSSDYQWRRTNCDFTNFPPFNGNIVDKYNLIDMMFERFNLAYEFSLGDFDPHGRITFDYNQAYIDADTGEFVPYDMASQHSHLEPLDGRVYRDEATGIYMIAIYPYAMESYVNLLCGLTILSHQVMSLEAGEEALAQPTTQMEIDSVGYAWTHRQALCSLDDELFDHHIDFLSRALQYRQMSEL